MGLESERKYVTILYDNPNIGTCACTQECADKNEEVAVKVYISNAFPVMFMPRPIAEILSPCMIALAAGAVFGRG